MLMMLSLPQGWPRRLDEIYVDVFRCFNKDFPDLQQANLLAKEAPPSSRQASRSPQFPSVG